MFTFVLTKAFLENVQALEFSLQKRIKEKIDFLSRQENPLFFSKKMHGYKDVFRFRMGDYRIVFRVSKKTIILLQAQHRRDVYKHF